ncbi:undecaprenyl/decaprenyl-phosphate alpha-N-acetylglucosaminyl 1-phosphate transferase [Streptomyces sp. NBC_00564]|uniref:undecaprenyl/decaprenyl-phosphate alpha-N-acetylglucosaminyl 1-phosphate transferase n=1 Tax=Streptomyces sp. NBC_00564 TaxID=2903663 RepID=UPI00352FA672|nr:undecaprenyl/decaprenyl-phosphate alpha-N-acetylglucosaminyl 1-phosphate transferase [Streptomyces sp. NBC_00564]
MLYGIVAAIAALLLTAALAALLRMFALRFGVVERRRLRVVPLLGGVAVVGGTALVAGAGEWTDVAPLGTDAGRLLVAGIGVALLGLVADLRAVPLAVQVGGVGVAAAVTVPYGELGLLGGVLGVAWIVFVTFAFVSLDHADGVMGTVGVVTAFALSGCAAAEVMDGTAALLSVLAAALTGFLMQGRPPARIVPGRCGALFAGFVLAGAAVVVHGGRETGAGVAALFSLTAVGLVDLALAARGPGGHLAHRLRRGGLTSRGVMVVIGAAAFGGALVGLLIDLGWVGAGAAWWVAGVAAVVVLVGGVGPGSRPRRPYPIPSPGGSAPRPPNARRARPQTPDGLKIPPPDRLRIHSRTG